MVKYLSWVPKEDLLSRETSGTCSCPCHVPGGQLCLPPHCCDRHWKGRIISATIKETQLNER